MELSELSRHKTGTRAHCHCTLTLPFTSNARSRWGPRGSAVARGRQVRRCGVLKGAHLHKPLPHIHPSKPCPSRVSPLPIHACPTTSSHRLAPIAGMEGHGRRGRCMLRRDAAARRGLVRRLGCVLEAPAQHCLPAGEAGTAIADAAGEHRRGRHKGESWAWRAFSTRTYGRQLASMAASGRRVLWRGDAWQVVGALVHMMAAACTCGMRGVCARAQHGPKSVRCAPVVLPM